MVDSASEGERGSVKPKGTIFDRRHSPPWTWTIMGLLLVLFALMTVAVSVGAIITRDIRKATEKASTAATNANTAAMHADTTATRLDGAVRGSCKRLQDERERANVAEATVFRVLRRAGRRYQLEAEATAWSPPANCERAVDYPTAYRPPPPVPFTKLPKGYAKRIILAFKAHKPQPLP